MAASDFSRAEYDARLDRTRAAMAARGLDLLVVSDPSNMAWLTGYDGWSFYVHQAVLVPAAGDPVWWGRGMDAAGALRTVWMPQDRILGYADSLVQNPDAHPMTDLAGRIADLGLAAGRIGVEADNYYYSAAADAALRAARPTARFLDATGLVNWQRAVKSATELTYIRRAARIVEAMHATIRAEARPGLAKNALIAEVLRTATLGADGHWGDYAAIVPMAPSGLDATAPHLTWDDTPLRSGQGTFFEIAGVHRRYHCPQSRTVFLGTLPDKYARAQDAVAESTADALAAARPGATCADVAAAFHAALHRHGFRKDSRCGYSIGLSYPPDWGERTMSLRAGDETELTAGMVFHFMPALWLDDGGLETTEPILIGPAGAERLCDTPAEICVIAS